MPSKYDKLKLCTLYGTLIKLRLSRSAMTTQFSTYPGRKKFSLIYSIINVQATIPSFVSGLGY